MVYVVVPGTPNPKNPVQLGMLLPFVEVVFSKNNPVQEEVVGNQTHLPHFYGRVLDIGTGYSLQNCNNVGSIPTSLSNDLFIYPTCKMGW